MSISLIENIHTQVEFDEDSNKNENPTNDNEEQNLQISEALFSKQDESNQYKVIYNCLIDFNQRKTKFEEEYSEQKNTENLYFFKPEKDKDKVSKTNKNSATLDEKGSISIVVENNNKDINILDQGKTKVEKKKKKRIGNFTDKVNIININEKERKLFHQNENLKDLYSYYGMPHKPKVFQYNKTRKDAHDNLSKKIKLKFCKSLIKVLNQRLPKKTLIKIFKKLAQREISDVTIEKNKTFFGKKLKQILSEKPKFIDKSSIESNWKNNKELVEYLENSGDKYFMEILNMSLEELYYDYLGSREFENAILELQNGGKGEKKKTKYYDDYITNYINVANNLINYYECFELYE